MLSLFAKLKNKYFQQFIRLWGREPQSAKEWMTIQDNAVRELNKTKGVPGGPKKPWHQGWNPQVIQGGKGIESLLESGVVKKGVAPKTKLSTLEGKKQKLDKAINKEEWIAKKQRENKEAVERFRKRTQKKTVEDFRDEGDWDPGGMASGGRIGMGIGGFTKAEVLIQMLKNTIKGSKDPYVKKTFPNWIKEIQANPSLANNENVWKNLTTGLPKNQRLIVHSDDSVDFFTQTEFGPHNIEKTLEFQKKHNLSRDQANTILRMEPEDRVLELKRLETIADRNKVTQSLGRGEDLSSVSPAYGEEYVNQLLEDWKPGKGKKGHASGGRVPLMYGGDPGFAFEYGGSWADWHDQHRDQMPVEQYIKTKLPKHRLPFREMQSGGRAGYDNGGLSSPRFKHPDKRQGILGSGVTWTELMEGLHPFMWSPRTIEGTKRDFIDPIFKKKLKWDELDEYYKQLEMDEDMREPENVPRRGEQYAASGGIAQLSRPGYFFGGPAAGKKALKAIMDAWRANKTWGVGGPPFRPEKTSFDIKALTKQNLGQEYSLSDLKKLESSPLMGKGGQTFDQFNQEFKNIKASILKEKLKESKIQAEAMIDSAEHTIKNANQEFNKAFGPLRDKKKQHDMAKKISDQFTREGKKQLEEAKEGLKEIDIYMGMLQKKGRSVHQSGGLAYMLGEPTYSVGGSVGHAPWHKPTGHAQPTAQQETPTPHVAGTPDPLKAPRGIPSLAPKNMDPAYMQQQMMQRAMMGQGPGTTGQGPRPMAAEGGLMRMGFKKGGDWSRRKFLQFIGGAAALPFIGKYFKAAKLAKPAAAVTETITRGADGMPKYIYDLIEVVKAKGTKDFIEGFKKSDYSTVHSYKGVDVIEHPSGATTIKKQHEGGGTYTTDEGIDESFDGITHEIEMEIRKGDYVKNKAGKMVKEGDEYVEYTAKPDMDGKLKDVEEYIDDMDHLDLKEIADEIDTLIIKKTKKASGGLAYMLGE